MAVTSGFFNSLNGDRTYDAEEFGQLFEGIIRDGIFQNVRGALKVSVGGGMKINVATGRCWFNNTWTDNDATLVLTIEGAHLLLNRIDTVCVRVDKRDAGRKNEIVIVKGTPASNPTVSLPNEEGLYHYPLAQIYVGKGVSEITTANLTDKRGQSPSVWITGPLSVISLDTTIAKVEQQWNDWLTSVRATETTSFQNLLSSNQVAFDSWFQTLRNNLDSNQVAAIMSKLIELENRLGTVDSGQVVYDDIRDSSGNSILDHDGNTIQAKLVYSLV